MKNAFAEDDRQKRHGGHGVYLRNLRVRSVVPLAMGALRLTLLRRRFGCRLR